MTRLVVRLDLRLPQMSHAPSWALTAVWVVASALPVRQAASQTAWDRIPPGTVVRVQTAALRVDGKFLRFAGDSLFLFRTGSQPTSDMSSFIGLRQDILRLAHRQGTSAGRGAMIGALTGLAAGIAIGAVAGPRLASESDLTAAGWTKVLALAGVLTGGGVGAVVGSTRPSWRRIE